VYSNTMKSFEEYRDIVVSMESDWSPEDELSEYKDFLRLTIASGGMNWDDLLEENNEEFNSVLNNYFSLTIEEVDLLTYDQMVDMITLSYISLRLME
jgi:hypothetical protein